MFSKKELNNTLSAGIKNMFPVNTGSPNPALLTQGLTSVDGGRKRTMVSMLATNALQAAL